MLCGSRSAGEVSGGTGDELREPSNVRVLSIQEPVGVLQCLEVFFFCFRTISAVLWPFWPIPHTRLIWWENFHPTASRSFVRGENTS